MIQQTLLLLHRLFFFLTSLQKETHLSIFYCFPSSILPSIHSCGMERNEEGEKLKKKKKQSMRSEETETYFLDEIRPALMDEMSFRPPAHSSSVLVFLFPSLYCTFLVHYSVNMCRMSTEWCDGTWWLTLWPDYSRSRLKTDVPVNTQK